MHIRSQSKRPDREYVEDEDPKILDILSWDSYHEKGLRESVREALDALPEMHSQVLMLHYLGGMKINEVARFLGASPRTIARRLDTAKSQLKEEIFGMMAIDLEKRRLPAGFTLHVMDIVSRINIQPIPRTTNLPWGLSLTAGILFVIMSLGSHLSITNPTFTTTSSIPASDMQIMEIGDIPVVVSNQSQGSYTLVGSGNDNGGEVNLSNQQNAVLMAPSGEGGKIPDKPFAQIGKGKLGGIAYSPDGKILAVSTGPGIRLYDANNLNEIGILQADKSYYYGNMTFSSDGKILAVGDYRGISLWDMQTQKQIGSIDDRSERGATFSPDGKISAIAGSWPDKTIHLWDNQKLEQIGLLQDNEDYIHSIAFTPDGKTLASVGSENKIRLWDIQSQKQIGLLNGNKKFVFKIAISPDGKVLASGGQEGELLLWNIQEQKLIASLNGHNADVGSLSFTPDGKTLASRSEDQTMRVWDVQKQKQIALLQVNKGEGYIITFNPDGRTLASINYEDYTIRFWDIQEQKQTGIIDGFTSVDSVAFSPDGKILVSGGFKIFFWSIADQKQIGKTDQGVSSGFPEVVFSPDGKILAGVGYDSIYLIDAQTQKQIGLLKGHTDYVRSIAFSPDGKLLASGSLDMTLRLWDVQQQKEVWVQNCPSHTHSVAFSPDGKFVASAIGGEGTVRIWDVKTKNQTDPLKLPGAGFCMAFSPDGKLLASGSRDAIVFWDFDKKKQLGTIVTGNNEIVYGHLLFSPDGKWLVAQDGGCGTCRIWDVETRELLGELKGHIGGIYNIAFSSDGKWLATVGGDSTILLWEVDIPIESKAVNPTGKFMGTWGEVKKSQLFQNYPNPFNPETWIPFSLSKPEHVKIKIFNSAGRLVRTLELGDKEPGAYTNREKAAYWDGRNDNGETVASDAYFTVIEAGEFRDLKKMVMVR